MTRGRALVMLGLADLAVSALLWLARSPLTEIRDKDLASLASVIIFCTAAMLQAMMALMLIWVSVSMKESQPA